MRPDAFAFVMATGIVSIAASDHGLHPVSVCFAVMAAVGLPVLMYLMAHRWDFNLRDHTVALPLFTYVAACAVLGARFDEHRIVLWLATGLALQGWITLAPLVVRSMWRQRHDLRAQARGGWELAAVATSGLAIVFADLGIVFWAVAFWALGMAVYVTMTSVIVRHVDLAQPDSWILIGGVAIATLAGDHLHHALPPGPFADAVRAVTLVTWVGATVWIPPLVYVALRRFAGIGWATVFPLGMYSSATYAMAAETGWRWFVEVSFVFLWVAVAAWVTVAVRSLRRLRRSPAAGTRSGQAT